MLFKELQVLCHSTLHPEIENPSTKIKKYRFQRYYQMRLPFLHIKPIDFNDFGVILFKSPESDQIIAQIADGFFFKLSGTAAP